MLKTPLSVCIEILVPEQLPSSVFRGIGIKQKCTDFALPASSMRRCEAVETHLDFGSDHLFDELPAQPLIIRKSQQRSHRKGAQAAACCGGRNAREGHVQTPAVAARNGRIEHAVVRSARYDDLRLAGR